MGSGVVSTAAQGGSWIQTVTWIAAASYRGPALVRGRQLDGSRPISFGTGVVADATELSLTVDTAKTSSRAPGWRQWPSIVAVSQPGCYGLQIDGEGFSNIVIFEAR
jgi:hypothetical protein